MSSPSPDSPGFDHAAMPAGWRDSLARSGADGATLARIEAAAQDHAGPVIPGRVARAGHALVTVLTPAGPLLTAAAAVAPGADVHLVSAVSGDGVGDLARRMGPGRTAALIGSSGAGKSSLLNALAGADVAATVAVRGADGKGRHTTAWRELVVLGQGGAVIDTPGLRGLGLWLDESGLDTAFADLAGLAADCRFSDCRHDTEPGCAVTSAIEAGTLEARRLASYRKLEREAAHVARKADPKAARAQARAWHAMTREASARARHRPRSS